MNAKEPTWKRVARSGGLSLLFKPTPEPTLEARLMEAIQEALNHEATLHRDPLGLYRPSPGQLPDHVHHRVARLAARVACEVIEESP